MYVTLYRFGEVPEWLNGAVSKTVIRVIVSGVQIPPSPPLTISSLMVTGGIRQALLEQIPPSPPAVSLFLMVKEGSG